MGFPILVRWHLYIESGLRMQASVTYVITVCDGVHGSNKPLSKPIILFNHQNENIKKIPKVNSSKLTYILSSAAWLCYTEYDYLHVDVICIYIYIIYNIPLFRNVHLALRFVMVFPITKLWVMLLCVSDLGNHWSMLWNVAYSVSSNYLSRFSLSTGP